MVLNAKELFYKQSSSLFSRPSSNPSSSAAKKQENGSIGHSYTARPLISPSSSQLKTFPSLNGKEAELPSILLRQPTRTMPQGDRQTKPIEKSRMAPHEEVRKVSQGERVELTKKTATAVKSSLAQMPVNQKDSKPATTPNKKTPSQLSYKQLLKLGSSINPESLRVAVLDKKPEPKPKEAKVTHTLPMNDKAKILSPNSKGVKKIMSSSSHLRSPVTKTTSPKKSTRKEQFIGGLIKLGTEKRDIRRIDEIQADLKNRKKGLVSSPNSTITQTEKSNKRPVAPVRKRPLNPSNDDLPQPTKKRAHETPTRQHSHSEANLSNDISRQIWEIMGMNREKYISRNIDSDDDDMEATGAEVWREEARSSRIARKEDEEEEIRLDAERRLKEQRKNSLAKKRV